MSVEVVPAVRADGEDEDERIGIAISSETEEIERIDWWTGDRFIEILDHSPEGIDLRYAEDGLAFLLEHGEFGSAGRAQLGLVEDVEVGSDRKLRGNVRFGAHPDAGWVRSDMAAGIRNKVSVGYKILEKTLTKEREDGVKIYRCKWMPFEASSVAIPADLSVGVGRSASPSPAKPEVKQPEPAEEARGDTMDPTKEGTSASAPEGAGEDSQARLQVVSDATDKARDAERDRVNQLMALGNRHGFGERVPEWVKDGTSLNEARALILEAQRDGTAPVMGGATVDLTPAEQQSYSVARAILQAYGLEKPGLEMEVHRALEELVPDENRSGRPGILVASDQMVAKRALDSVTATAGAEGVFDVYEGFLPMLRNKAVVLRAGALMEGGLQGNPSFVGQSGAATAHWRDENPGTDTPESQPAFRIIKATPKTLSADVRYTREQLQRSVFATDTVVERDLAIQHALAIDLAGLHGSGVAPVPEGVQNVTGVGAVAMGGVVTYGKVVDMETEVGVSNAEDLGAMAYITTPEQRGKAKQTQVFAGTSGAPIWTGSIAEGEMNGYKAFATNQILKTLGGGAEHGIFFAVWSQMMVGEWGVLELIIDPYSLKRRALIEVTSFQMADILLKYPEAFVFGTGLTLT